MEDMKIMLKHSTYCVTENICEYGSSWYLILYVTDDYEICMSSKRYCATLGAQYHSFMHVHIQ